MSRWTIALNCSICGYIGLKLFGYPGIISAAPSLRILFVVAPVALLAWQALLLYPDLARRNSLGTEQPFYERIDSADWWRTFWVLWIGHTPSASAYLLGFYVFTALVISLLGLIAYIASVDSFRQKAMTPLAVGLLAFGYFLLSWEKSTYVEHYGVPIIGHVLEKPEYHAKYQVEVRPEDSSTPAHAVADIQVKGRTESEDHGEEDWFGQPIIRTDKYRDVWVNKLHLSGGRTATIEEQDEPLHVGESVLVRDSEGRAWHVRLINEPIR